MKPNKKQIKVCEIIESQGNFWGATNDINSPTHWCDIEEVLGNSVLFEELEQAEATELETRLEELFTFVKSLK